MSNKANLVNATVETLNASLDALEADDAAEWQAAKAKALDHLADSLVPFRTRADSVLSLFPEGYRSPYPVLNEHPLSYWVRVLEPIRQKLPRGHELRKVPLERCDAATLDIMSRKIFDAVEAYARSDDLVPDGETYERDMTQPGGPRTTEFYGTSFIKGLTRPGRKVSGWMDLDLWRKQNR